MLAAALPSYLGVLSITGSYCDNRRHLAQEMHAFDCLIHMLAYDKTL